VTKVRTIETIAIEKFFLPGKWLSSLRKLISFLLMTSFSKESSVSSFYRFIPGTFFFTCPGWLIVFLVSAGLLLSLVVLLTNLMGSSFPVFPLFDPSS
jgi:hypothetical protein